ncbi:MAG: hypothetical protein ABL949_03330 [Fimbriimonadaceae bacterium]
MQVLSDLRGLDTAKSFLSRIAVDPPIHSILLYGAESAAIEELSSWLALSWMCLEPSEEGPCGECQVCGAYGRGNLADFQDVVPRSSQNQILIGAIVEHKDRGTTPVSVFSRSMPLMSRSKVIRIQSCERLNIEAANAFLKMLEEPAPYMRFILTTRAVGSVLPTIRSRCVTVCCESPKLEGGTVEDRVKFELPWANDLAPEVFGGFCELADTLLSTQPMMALKLAEDFRSLTEGIVPAEGARLKYARALELFGTILGLKSEQHRRFGSQIAEVHRRILGNCHSGYALDDLFIKLLKG